MASSVAAARGAAPRQVPSTSRPSAGRVAIPAPAPLVSLARRPAAPVLAPRRELSCRAHPDAPPSYAPGGTELERLGKYTCVVPDSMLSELEGGFKPKAATVNSAFILGVLRSPYGMAQFKSAVAGALAYDKCRIEVGDMRIACQMDKALVNVGTVLTGQVEGRVSTEVDPRLASNTEAIVTRAHVLCDMYKENSIPMDRILLTIPCTWEGLQAVKLLEKEGVQCHVIHCYSFVQAVTAAQAGASVIQMNIGRINDWYKKHPNFIRDPKGPREDAGLKSEVDPGVELVKKVYTYIKKFHPKTQIIVSGVRNKEQALALCGMDYIVASPQVMESLSNTATLQGYNDGMVGVISMDDFEVVLSKDMALASDMLKISNVSQSLYAEELGYMGFDLVKTGVEGNCANVRRCEPFFMSQVGGQE